MAKRAVCRQTPEVGAECPNWARSDLSGGRSDINERPYRERILLTFPALTTFGFLSSYIDYEDRNGSHSGDRAHGQGGVTIRRKHPCAQAGS